jgi:hypothetical protein
MIEHIGDLVDGLFRDLAGRHHHPDGAGLVELLGELGERRGPRGALARQRLDRIRVDVVDHALVAAAHQPPDDVGSHPAEADHSELCHRASSSTRARDRVNPMAVR